MIWEKKRVNRHVPEKTKGTPKSALGLAASRIGKGYHPIVFRRRRESATTMAAKLLATRAIETGSGVTAGFTNHRPPRAGRKVVLPNATDQLSAVGHLAKTIRQVLPFQQDWIVPSMPSSARGPWLPKGNVTTSAGCPR